MSNDHTPHQCPAGYEVRRDGSIWSVEGKWRGLGPRQMIPYRDSHGYLMVRLSSDKARKAFHVHNLVAGEFLPSRPTPAHEIRHLNGDRLDNRAGNLTWGTRKDNADDRARHGRTSHGAKHSAAIKQGLGSRHG